MHPVETFELILALLATVVALHWVAARIGLPPSATLLVGGGALAFVPGLPSVTLDPELALVLFLPPLLMDGAYYTAFGRARRHLPGILSLAVGAVLFTTLAVGVVTHSLVPQLPWAACFALGAVVSPPDAIAARAVLQRVKLPRRLQALLEGESLLNDATGLVLRSTVGEFSGRAPIPSEPVGEVRPGQTVTITGECVRASADELRVVLTLAEGTAGYRAVVATDQPHDIGGHRLRFIPTPHVPHNWEAGLWFDETTSTLLAGDLFTHVGQCPAVTEADVVAPALDAEGVFHATGLNTNLAPTLEQLAQLEPTTLALMHGASYSGDGAAQLRALSDGYAAMVAAS